ncbi:putative reverse transcriptase domain-containing protein [Tanacetum coccineum]
MNNNNNNKNNNNDNNANNRNGGNNGCSYKTFLACNPRDYDGKGGAIALIRWIEKMKSVIDNSRCAENQKVKYAAISFINKALTWWNTQVQERGREAVGLSSRRCLWKSFVEVTKWRSWRVNFGIILWYINGLAPQIHGMLRATQPTTIQSAILKVGILTDEAVRCGTLTRSSKKRKEVEETSKQGGSWKDNKKEKVGKGFVVTTPPRNENVGSYPKCAKCSAYHPESGPCRMGNIQRVCYECGSFKHLRNTCPKLNRAPGQAGNCLALEGNRNTRNNGNQVSGRAFNVNAVDALQDPNIVTGTFSLNDHFATVLFDSRADFSFISTKFAPLLNVKPSIVSHGYVIEVANDLIPLGHGSFDVIVGMDWLSKNKVEIVCHEKVVRIPLEGGEILRIQGKRTLGGTKILMSTKADEPKLSDIPIVRDFTDVFPEDLSRLPPQRQVEFRIDLIPGATPVAKSPYRLAPSEMQELSEKLQELEDKGFIRPSHSP